MDHSAMNSGCWKSCGVFALIVTGLIGFLFWRIDRAIHPPLGKITSITELSHTIGLTFPKSVASWDGYGWYDTYFVVARVRFSRADLKEFLAQKHPEEIVDGLGHVKGTVQKDLDSTLKLGSDSEQDIFHDECNIERGEDRIVTSWNLKHIHNFKIGNLSQSPITGTTHSGSLNLLIDLDDPQTVTVYVNWDARGGFAC